MPSLCADRQLSLLLLLASVNHLGDWYLDVLIKQYWEKLGFQQVQPNVKGGNFG